jgi:hypothetical protein
MLVPDATHSFEILQAQTVTFFGFSVAVYFEINICMHTLVILKILATPPRVLMTDLHLFHKSRNLYKERC